MALEINTEDQAAEGASLTAGLIMQTIGRRGTSLRYVVLGILFSSRIKKTRRLREASYEPLAAAPAPPATDHVIDIPLQERFSNKVARIVREKDLNSLHGHGGVERILPLLRSHFEEGAVDGGQNPEGWNITKSPVEAKGFLYFLFEACNRYTIFFFFLSAGFSFAIEFMKQGVKDGWHDGVAILITAFLLIAFPTVQNYRNQRKSVQKHLLDRSKLMVNVERSSTEPTPITISGVVVGDIVHLKEGDRVLVDGLFIDQGEELVVDEVLSPKIDCEQNPFVFSGSKVVKGRGRMIVTSVGANTAIADMLSLVSDRNPLEKTLLQALMDKSNACMDFLACCVSILIALVMLIRLLFFKKYENYNERPDLKGEVSMNFVMRIFENIFLKPQGKVSILASVLATVVIGIQHGMHVVITADPQDLSASVTMGLITVICIETTADLMCNQTEVKEFWIGEKDLSSGEVDSETDQVLEALHQGISATASPANDRLISWLNTRWGSNAALVDRRFATVEQRQWNSNEKYRGVLVRKIENDEQIMQLHCDGEASTILGMCSHYFDNRGESHNIGNQKRKFEEVIKKMEKKGLTPIAYAYKKTEAEDPTEDGLILLALVGLRCPYQEELKLAVEALRKAGVSIKLVSEDELSKVRARASELGISPGSDDTEIEGQAFRRLNSMEKLDKVDLISVMGSSLPKDKFLMVERLKKKGHIVAFYGGLTISDTLTLKEADIGIVEDLWSTEMARENADLIIRNGCFLSMNMRSGACAYHNIQQFTQLQLTACISGLLVTLVATMHLGESPLTAVHLIWVNLIMCLLGGPMMAMELQGTERHTQRPAKRTESLITKGIWRNIAVQVSYQASVLLILHCMGNIVPSMNEGVRNTMIFNTFTLCQVLNMFSTMDIVKKEVLQVVLRSHWFLMALAAVLIIQVIIVEFGKGLASCVRLNALQWLICCVLAALSWGSVGAFKFLSAHLQRTTSALMVSSHVELSHRQRRLYIPIWFYVPIWLFLIFSVSSYCIRPEISPLALYIR
ncbi:calcium-transporting ATPase 12 [Pyrus ussuriensis x Pyrus communis]|uniref:Calcium-transporting ATPase 12 n=1 Tax=Pyrus ussuriensis x Pyrus communis TaxID=2448454 RepID=A0A5N5GEH5_9ROSA|nr:calcium-transporting ATPase 12 [Pyrus ussuriensis x Pyrus communis]